MQFWMMSGMTGKSILMNSQLWVMSGQLWVVDCKLLS